MDLGLDHLLHPGRRHFYSPELLWGRATLQCSALRTGDSRGISVSAAALVFRPANSAADPALLGWPVCRFGSCAVHGQHELELPAQAFRFLRAGPVEGAAE